MTDRVQAPPGRNWRRLLLAAVCVAAFFGVWVLASPQPRSATWRAPSEADIAAGLTNAEQQSRSEHALGIAARTGRKLGLAVRRPVSGALTLTGQPDKDGLVPGVLLVSCSFGFSAKVAAATKSEPSSIGGLATAQRRALRAIVQGLGTLQESPAAAGVRGGVLVMPFVTSLAGTKRVDGLGAQEASFAASELFGPLVSAIDTDARSGSREPWCQLFQHPSEA